MKLFIDGHFLDGRKHGVAIYLDRLYTEYRNLKPDDELHFGLELGAKADYVLFSMPRVYVHRYRFGGALRFICDIPYILRKINADIVHTQYVVPLRLGYVAKRHVTLHDVLYEDFPELFSPFYRWIRRIVFGFSARRAELITSVSKYSRLRISNIYGRNINDIHIVCPGVVDDDEFELLPVDVIRENSILYVSRFERRKNHFTLLNSFMELRKSNPTLRMVLVGFEVDGTLAQVRDFITRHGMADEVEIRSHISEFDLEGLYRTSGVVIYPSFAEGFGMPIIEAFLLNPNTLYSNCTAMAELELSSNNTFDPNVESEITSKIEYSLRFRNKYNYDWQEKRKEVVYKYNWRRSAKILVDIYLGSENI